MEHSKELADICKSISNLAESDVVKSLGYVALIYETLIYAAQKDKDGN